jgi:protein-disulfide isomerase/uncharacterized membrane protein
MSIRLRFVIVISLLIVGTLLSGLLLFEHRGEARASAAVEAVCGEAETSGCGKVSRSPYSEVMGVPVAAVGMAFCLSLALLLALSLLAESSVGKGAGLLVLLGLGLALLGDIALLGLQAFVIRAYCRVCIATYVVNLVSFVVLWPCRKALVALRGSLASPEARQLGAGWVASTVALLVAVLAVDDALARRAAASSGLLGAPTAPLVDSPLVSGHTAAPPDATGCGEQARRALSEVQKLQQILDDPQKLQQYLNEKAAREFERSPVASIDLTGVPPLGPATAPIRVVTFSDFLCPWCRNLAGALSGFVPQVGGRVAVHFKHYPLEGACNPNVKGAGHVGSCLLAVGAICATEQGKFWPYHDRAFEANVQPATRETVLKLAEQAGLQAGPFATCLDSAKAKARLTAEIAEGKAVGVSGTPTVFINGRRLPGINNFLLAIERESQRLGLPPPNQPPAP